MFPMSADGSFADDFTHGMQPRRPGKLKRFGQQLLSGLLSDEQGQMRALGRHLARAGQVRALRREATADLSGTSAPSRSAGRVGVYSAKPEPSSRLAIWYLSSGCQHERQSARPATGGRSEPAPSATHAEASTPVDHVRVWGRAPNATSSRHLGWQLLLRQVA